MRRWHRNTSIPCVPSSPSSVFSCTSHFNAASDYGNSKNPCLPPRGLPITQIRSFSSTTDLDWKQQSASLSFLLGAAEEPRVQADFCCSWARTARCSSGPHSSAFGSTALCLLPHGKDVRVTEAPLHFQPAVHIWVQSGSPLTPLEFSCRFQKQVCALSSTSGHRKMFCSS